MRNKTANSKYSKAKPYPVRLYGVPMTETINRKNYRFEIIYVKYINARN